MDQEKNKISSQQITACLGHYDFDDKALTSIGKRLSKVNSALKKLASIPQDSSFIVMLEDNEPKSCLPLEKDEFLIGRTPECDIIINSENISREHCKLYMNNGNWTVCDNDSKNGIFVNGEKTNERILCDGDIIHTGNIELIFVKKSDIDPFEEL
jgi:hypothetical protein